MSCIVNSLFLTSFSGIETNVSAAVEITNLDWWVGSFPSNLRPTFPKYFDVDIATTLIKEGLLGCFFFFSFKSFKK